MNKPLRLLFTWAGLLTFALFIDAGRGSSFLVEEAHAVVGMPATPGSVAGVARRTTRRTIRRSTIYVASLPPHCTVVVIEGASLHQCGGTYYQPYNNQFVVVYVE